MLSYSESDSSLETPFLDQNHHHHNNKNNLEQHISLDPEVGGVLTNSNSHLSKSNHSNNSPATPSLNEINFVNVFSFVINFLVTYLVDVADVGNFVSNQELSVKYQVSEFWDMYMYINTSYKVFIIGAQLQLWCLNFSPLSSSWIFIFPRFSWINDVDNCHTRYVTLCLDVIAYLYFNSPHQSSIYSPGAILFYCGWKNGYCYIHIYTNHIAFKYINNQTLFFPLLVHEQKPTLSYSWLHIFHLEHYFPCARNFYSRPTPPTIPWPTNNSSRSELLVLFRVSFSSWMDLNLLLWTYPYIPRNDALPISLRYWFINFPK